jgi:hypothetical protein
MTRRSRLLALLGPVFVGLASAGVLSFSSMLAFVVVVTVGLPVVLVTALAAVLFFGIYCARRLRGKADEEQGFLIALSAGLALGLAILITSVVWTGPVLQAARAPVREMLAERVIERARQGPYQPKTRVLLRDIRALLSDSGEIWVYRDGPDVAVLFWDVRGILDSYSASIYSSDPERLPTPLLEELGPVHESGHWWRTVGE